MVCRIVAICREATVSTVEPIRMATLVCPSIDSREIAGHLQVLDFPPYNFALSLEGVHH